MPELLTDMHLSRTQAAVLDEKNIQRFTGFMRTKCIEASGSKACGLVVEVTQAERTACVSCVNCSAPAAQSFAAVELPSLANALILDTDLVQDPEPNVNFSHLRLVEALDSIMANENTGVIISGHAATVVEPIGYAHTLSNRQVLFPVTGIEGQGGAIEPGVPVLIEFPEPR